MAKPVQDNEHVKSLCDAFPRQTTIPLTPRGRKEALLHK
jgi:hypothetical protein